MTSSVGSFEAFSAFSDALLTIRCTFSVVAEKQTHVHVWGDAELSFENQQDWFLLQLLFFILLFF